MFSFFKDACKRFQTTTIVIHSDLTIFGAGILSYRGKVLRCILDDPWVKSIFVPTFNLDTNSSTITDMSLPPRGMGALAVEAVDYASRGEGLRVPNPIHSYTVVGEIPARLATLNHHKSFGAGSVFDYFCDLPVLWFCVGPQVNEGFTLFHHFEEVADVPYREHLNFDRSLKYDGNITNVNYSYFGRKSDQYIEDFEPMVSSLLSNGILDTEVINGRSIYYGRCDRMIEHCIKVLNHNKFALVKTPVG